LRGYNNGFKSLSSQAKKICRSKIYADYHKGLKIGRESADIGNEIRKLKYKTEKLTDNLSLVKDDMRNGTNITKVSGDKLDVLRAWERESVEVTREIEALMSRNVELLNQVETHILEDLPQHWQDVK